MESDAMLVKFAKEGNDLAFETLFKRHYKKIFGLALNILRNREDAEDAVQNTAIKAYVNLRSFEERSQFGTWLYRIGANQALMTLRKRRDAVISLDDLSCEGECLKRKIENIKDERSPSPEDIAIKRSAIDGSRGQGLNSAIRKLTPSMQTIVKLRMIQEYSVKETSRLLGIPMSTVKSRSLYAKRKLQTLLLGLPR